LPDTLTLTQRTSRRFTQPSIKRSTLLCKKPHSACWPPVFSILVKVTDHAVFDALVSRFDYLKLRTFVANDYETAVKSAEVKRQDARYSGILITEAIAAPPAHSSL